MNMNLNEIDIVFYDGDCGLCSRFIQLILKFEKNPNYYFCPLDSDLSRKILGHRTLDSVVLKESEELYYESSAALRILRKMKFPLSLLFGFIIIPPILRDTIYKIIAVNRRRFFKDNTQCLLLDESIKHRFL
ncbi:hypothetical protein BIY24_04420 [Halobacteriovorax marinus]|uniref:thiol-disulfide oxidoreductase DCC family protein n=1 Tax=Halobacteriovorax marinus TaxID=97084 RepID=UPI000BC3611E|nr:DCC1-like thiol-disulfide oxidoreductase family protein [Halobacteriovorax marinus]ATH07208.1 hypothetical protein BIY24_04420 [Halobacteriovorax marinus]